jgi:hypothetical protein
MSRHVIMAEPVVVYSCVTRGYDHVAPAPASSHTTFLLFHDGSIDVPEGWQGVPLQVPGIDGIHLNRYAKMCPHRLNLPTTRSLYIDGNIACKQDPSDLVSKVLANARFAAFAHPTRDCAYDELREALRLGFIAPSKAWAHRRLFDRMGLPRHVGLMEAGILFRHHDDRKVQQLGDAWWDLWQVHRLLRDQPLLMAAAHASKTKLTGLGPNPIHTDQHPTFKIVKHSNPRTRQSRLPNRLAAELMLYRLWAR